MLLKNAKTHLSPCQRQLHQIASPGFFVYNSSTLVVQIGQLCAILNLSCSFSHLCQGHTKLPRRKAFYRHHKNALKSCCLNLRGETSGKEDPAN